MKFGELTVLRKADERTSDRVEKWMCRCSCGNETIVRRGNLISGNTKSCGCIKHVEDLTGKTFGRLTVLDRAEDYVYPSGCKERMWRCKCECGNEVVVRGKRLRNGTTKSCGCIRREMMCEREKIHGYSGERLNIIWNGMVQRCCNENNPYYNYYGGRGIKICDEWRNDYVAFREWALSTGYDENAEHGECTLDRIDVDGDYEPDNCRWVSQKEQNRNKRNTLKFSYNGQEKSLAEWCEESNFPYDRALYRLKHGWTFEEALEF